MPCGGKPGPGMLRPKAPGDSRVVCSLVPELDFTVGPHVPRPLEEQPSRPSDVGWRSPPVPVPSWAFRADCLAPASLPFLALARTKQKTSSIAPCFPGVVVITNTQTSDAKYLRDQLSPRRGLWLIEGNTLFPVTSLDSNLPSSGIKLTIFRMEV